MGKLVRDKYFIALIVLIVCTVVAVAVAQISGSSSPPAANISEDSKSGTADTVSDEADYAENADSQASSAMSGWAAIDETLIPDMLAVVAHQARVDELLLIELNSGYYSLEDPFVVIDPYGKSPLSALALFTSDEPMNVSVHVPGATAAADIDFTFVGYHTVHKIPILGLLPNTLNLVTLTGRTQSGLALSVILELRTDSLPPELCGDIIITNSVFPESISPGVNFTYAHKTAFDVNGDYRWFYNDFWLRGFALYDYNGHMVFAKGAYHQGDVLLIEVNMLGKIISVFHSPYGVHHEITSRNGENLIINGSRGATVEDFIYELDVRTGYVVNRLDLKKVLQRTRFEGFPSFDPVDWFHHNSTVYEDGHIIISGRHQSTVAKLSWPEGALHWILADHVGWSQMFHQYLLTPIGDDFEWSYGQHAAQVLPNFDNNPDTIDILLFDNGNGRFDHDRALQLKIANNEIVAPEHYSRVVHYRINEREMTIEQVWQFGKELGFTYFSEAWSNAVLLENGNVLGVFDRYIAEHGGNLNANIVEVDADGQIIWEAFGTSSNAHGAFHVYRVVRLPLYNDAANNLSIGVPAQVFIPQ
ncbi:MAG: aryl-sulfate sulfotransferase [Oscillospiraceae bacterium]|nr:aryl-sulfate sulfotransferase [Oscillospiraceae bacterium]